MITTNGQAFWSDREGRDREERAPGHDSHGYDLVMASTTFNLGTKDIPLPESKPLAEGAKYYTPAVGGRVSEMIWSDSELVRRMLRAGRVFLDHGAARQMSEDIDRLVKLALKEAHWSCDV